MVGEHETFNYDMDTQIYYREPVVPLSPRCHGSKLNSFGFSRPKFPSGFQEVEIT
jgi:hypothetical protein